MCYNGKCLHCIEVETGALIFAILNVMVTSLGSVVSVGGLIYTTFITQVAMRKADEEGDEKLMAGALVFGLATNALFAILAVCFVIAFSFAVVLIVGLCKRKAGHVKTYFVYGMVKMVFGIAGMIVMLANGLEFSAIFGMIVCYSIYALLLTMIHMTYKKFQNEVPYNTFSNQMTAIQKF